MPDLNKRLDKLERFMAQRERLRRNQEANARQDVAANATYYAEVLMTLAETNTWDDVIPVPLSLLKIASPAPTRRVQSSTNE